jgi:UDP-3-O-[3-hydroxymyristoyl] N-acetylglucosamine deacetylase
VGRRIIGRVVADRAGHAMHTALVSRLLRDRTLWEETTEETSTSPAYAPSPSCERKNKWLGASG